MIIFSEFSLCSWELFGLDILYCSKTRARKYYFKNHWDEKCTEKAPEFLILFSDFQCTDENVLRCLTSQLKEDWVCLFLFYFLTFYFISEYSWLTILCFRCTVQWFSYIYTCIYPFSNSYSELALLFRERCFQQQSKGSPVAVAILWLEGRGGREREGGRNFAGLIKISCTISCIVEVGAS